MARRKTKTVVVNPTPLFDAERYDLIINEINAGLEKLNALQVEILAKRAEQRAAYEAENRRREVEDKKVIELARRTKLVMPKETPKRKKPSRSKRPDTID